MLVISKKIYFLLIILLLKCSTPSYQTHQKITYGCLSGNCDYGIGTFTNLNGNKYVGDFKDSKFNGKGTYTFYTGDRYVGNFKNDKFYGSGVYYNADGSIYQKGLWNNDEFVGKSIDQLKETSFLKNIPEKNYNVFELRIENDDNLKFRLAYFNDKENPTIYNSYEYKGDEFDFNKEKEKLRKIRNKKYILILSNSNIYTLSDYDFKKKGFMISINIDPLMLDGGVIKSYRYKSNPYFLKINEDDAKEFKSSVQKLLILAAVKPKIENYAVKTVGTWLFDANQTLYPQYEYSAERKTLKYKTLILDIKNIEILKDNDSEDDDNDTEEE